MNSKCVTGNLKFLFSDRFRTTNNMLGDCYAAAVVEKLSKKELMACDAILSQVRSGYNLIYFNVDF